VSVHISYLTFQPAPAAYQHTQRANGPNLQSVQFRFGVRSGPNGFARFGAAPGPGTGLWVWLGHCSAPMPNFGLDLGPVHQGLGPDRRSELNHATLRCHAPTRQNCYSDLAQVSMPMHGISLWPWPGAVRMTGEIALHAIVAPGEGRSHTLRG